MKDDTEQEKRELHRGEGFKYHTQQLIHQGEYAQNKESKYLRELNYLTLTDSFKFP